MRCETVLTADIKESRSERAGYDGKVDSTEQGPTERMNNHLQLSQLKQDYQYNELRK